MLEENELYERVWGELPPAADHEQPQPPRRVLSLAFPPLDNSAGTDGPGNLENQISQLNTAIAEIKSAIATLPQTPSGMARRFPAPAGADNSQLRTDLAQGLAEVSDNLAGQMEALHREMTSRFDEQQELTLKFLRSMESAAVSLNKIASQPHRSRFGRD